MSSQEGHVKVTKVAVFVKRGESAVLLTNFDLRPRLIIHHYRSSYSYWLNKIHANVLVRRGCAQVRWVHARVLFLLLRGRQAGLVGCHVHARAWCFFFFSFLFGQHQHCFHHQSHYNSGTVSPVFVAPVPCQSHPTFAVTSRNRLTGASTPQLSLEMARSRNRISPKPSRFSSARKGYRPSPRKSKAGGAWGNEMRQPFQVWRKPRRKVASPWSCAWAILSRTPCTRRAISTSPALGLTSGSQMSRRRLERSDRRRRVGGALPFLRVSRARQASGFGFRG